MQDKTASSKQTMLHTSDRRLKNLKQRKGRVFQTGNSKNKKEKDIYGKE